MKLAKIGADLRQVLTAKDVTTVHCEGLLARFRLPILGIWFQPAIDFN